MAALWATSETSLRTSLKLIHQPIGKISIAADRRILYRPKWYRRLVEVAGGDAILTASRQAIADRTLNNLKLLIFFRLSTAMIS